MRSFIAINLPETVREHIGDFIRNLKSAGGNVKWVRSGNIHITLKFLGELEEHKIENIQDVIKRIASNNKPFQVSLEGKGGFPNLSHPRILWIGIQTGYEALKQIAEDMESSLEPLGFLKEKRSFSPHVTVGRVRSVSDIRSLTERMQKMEFKKTFFKVDQIELIKSDLTPRGPIYTPILTCKIGE